MFQILPGVQLYFTILHSSELKRFLQWTHLCMLLTVHIGIYAGNIHQARGKQHNGL